MVIINKSSNVIPFEVEHIRKSIYSAAKAVYGTEVDGKIDTVNLAADVEKSLLDLNVEKIGIETVQDTVERTLMASGHYEVAKAYILYREKRAAERETKNDLISYSEVMNGYLDKSDWRQKENSNVNYSLGGSILHNNGAITANYWLKRIYSQQVADAHRNADFHLHDISMFCSYCCGHSLRELITRGITGVPDKVSSGPAHHLSTLCQQIVNYLGILQNEWAGAQAFSSVDTYLAPFIKKDAMTYKEVYQCCQTLLYGINTPSRWGSQSPFSNFTHDWTVAKDLKDKKAIVGGEEQSFTYGDCQAEMDMFNKAFFTLFSEGDSQGRSFQYPIPTINITPEFWAHSPENQEILFKLTSKFGTPYFQNFINSDMDVGDVRSMCPLSGDTKVLVRSSKGVSILPIVQVVNSMNQKDSEYEVYLNGTWSKARPVLAEKQKVYDVTLSNGSVITFGENHLQPKLKEVNCINEVGCILDTVSVADLRVGDRLPYNAKAYDVSGATRDQYLAGYAVGAYYGDGSHDGGTVVYSLCIDERDNAAEKTLRDFWEPLGYRVVTKECDKVRFVRVTADAYNVISRFIGGTDAKTKSMTRDVLNTSVSFREGVLAGYQATNGAEKSNRISTSSAIMVEDLKSLCASLGKKALTDTRESRLGTDPNYIVSVPKRPCYGTAFAEYGDYIFYSIVDIQVNESYAGDLYCFEVDNEEHLFTLGDGLVTHNCRLRLDKRELRKRGGGLFGSAELTGSIGVVTLNMPRLGYLANDEKDFYTRLDYLMDLARDSLEVKRKVLTKNLADGLYPYTKAYVSSFDNFFSTLGVLGMNEACRNLFGSDVNIGTEQGRKFALDVLNHMRNRIADYQVETGNLYNLESTPSESTCYRLALHDKKKYPDIITAGSDSDPYYTNSTNLPVGYTDDPWVAIEHQEPLQTAYNGGTVLHTFLGQQLEDADATKNFIKKVFENSRIPYLTISPVYSICPIHGYLPGKQERCPKCREEQVKAYKKKLSELKKKKAELESFE